MAEEDGLWEKLGPASFQLDGKPELKFMLVRQQIRSGNRIAKRERPYRAGAKLDTTGPRADEIPVTAIFHNDLEEPGIEPTTVGLVWPDQLNKLDEYFRTGETGTLHLPWRRNIRCKASDWTRTAAATEERDGERLEVTFLEDNEDNLDAAVAELTSVNAKLGAALEQATLDMEELGAWEGSWADFEALAAEVEAFLNAPSEFAKDLLQKARRLGRACQRIISAFTSNIPGHDSFNRPDGANAYNGVFALWDMADAAAAEAEASLPKTTTRVYQTDKSLGDVAAELGQNYRKLLSINGEIEDPSFIEAGTQIKVFQ